MKNLLKTLALLTAGVGAVAVVKRVREKESYPLDFEIDNKEIVAAFKKANKANNEAEKALDEITYFY